MKRLIANIPLDKHVVRKAYRTYFQNKSLHTMVNIPYVNPLLNMDIKHNTIEPYISYPSVLDIFRALPIDATRVSAIFQYGSRVYGCNSPNADYDIIMISDCEKQELRSKDIDITIYSHTRFSNMLIEHEISALECIYLDPKFILMCQGSNHHYDFKLNLQKLRHSISEKASHSFVKAKKKLTVEADLDIYTGKKSLFHSLRIIMFGIQLAKFNKIIDYAEANYLYRELMDSDTKDWNYYKQKYQPEFNKLMTEFRKLALK